jgi:hypothetical protein
VSTGDSFMHMLGIFVCNFWYRVFYDVL